MARLIRSIDMHPAVRVPRDPVEAVLLHDDPDGVDDPGEVAEEGQDEADPELDLHVRMRDRRMN